MPVTWLADFLKEKYSSEHSQYKNERPAIFRDGRTFYLPIALLS